MHVCAHTHTHTQTHTHTHTYTLSLSLTHCDADMHLHTHRHTQNTQTKTKTENNAFLTIGMARKEPVECSVISFLLLFVSRITVSLLLEKGVYPENLLFLKLCTVQLKSAIRKEKNLFVLFGLKKCFIENAGSQLRFSSFFFFFLFFFLTSSRASQL